MASDRQKAASAHPGEGAPSVMSSLINSSGPFFPESPSEEGDTLLHHESSSSSNTRLAPRLFDLHNIELVGRRQEQSVLLSCFERVSRPKGPSEAVLISGVSGTGKSKLAGSIRKHVTLKEDGFFVSGKFDLQRNDPYSALVEAFTDLCDLACTNQGVCEKVTEALRDEHAVLSKLVPNLSTVLSGVTQRECTGPQNNGQGTFLRVKVACRKFLRAIATEEHPVVLLLDDLQWADQASIEVIQSIVTDTSSSHLMLMCTFRSDSSHGYVGQLLTTLNTQVPVEEACLRCERLCLENFDLSRVESVIETVLKRKSNETASTSSSKDLADLVFRRTAGNPFFVVKFLEMLRDRGFLVYNESRSSKWTWSVERIQSETEASANVLEVIKDRLHRLDNRVQLMLQLASVQGACFDRDIIKVIIRKDVMANRSMWQSEDDHAPIENLVDITLDIAEKQGLIETNKDGSMQFCHDQIQECMYFMIHDSEEVEEMHLAVAHAMMELEASHVMAFAVADQLNRASSLIKTQEAKLDCATHNLQAAKLAMSKAAYSLSAQYAQFGIAKLDPSMRWDGDSYQTSIDLHCCAGEALYCAGDFEQSDKHLDEVFANVKSVDDGARAHFTKVSSLAAQAKLEEAVDSAFESASKLGGIKLPKNPSMGHAMGMLLKTKLMLIGKSDESLLSLPIHGNSGYAAAAFLLGMAVHNASLSKKIPHAVIASASMMQMSLRGQSSSPIVFAIYGMLETIMGNVRGAVRMLTLCARLYEMHDYPGTRPNTMSLCHVFLHHWRHQLKESLVPLAESYHLGMEIADTHVGFTPAVAWIQAAFYAGTPLNETEHQTRQYCMQMQELGNKTELYLALPYWQACLNFMGEGKYPLVLSGEAMIQHTFQEEALQENVELAPQTLNAIRIMLAVHFEDRRLLEMMITELEEFAAYDFGHFIQYYAKLYFAMGYIDLYRGHQKRRHKAKAQKFTAQLHKWTKAGSPNAKPVAALLDAELATIGSSRQLKNAHDLFEKAIDEAIEANNCILEALANERVSRLLYEQGSDVELARRYLNRAIGLYESWGAKEKVDFLEKRCVWVQDNQKSQPQSHPLEIVAG